MAMETYETGFHAIADTEAISADRGLLAGVLLDAVMQSFRPHDYRARRWLSGIYAQTLLLLLDINPDAALQSLHKKWRQIDADAPSPDQLLN
ncbi:hypothetical protein [Acidithiobacillus thiooxidans]|nr:hypothetical protein [Acidithiobacillus thiooxidans]